MSILLYHSLANGTRVKTQGLQSESLFRSPKVPCKFKNVKSVDRISFQFLYVKGGHVSLIK